MNENVGTSSYLSSLTILLARKNLSISDKGRSSNVAVANEDDPDIYIACSESEVKSDERFGVDK